MASKTTAALLLFFCSASYSQCQSDTLKINLPTSRASLIINARYCPEQTQGKQINISLSRKGQPTQHDSLSCDADCRIKLDQPKIFPKSVDPVFALHTGGGRDGSETAYYRVRLKGGNLLKMGVMPELQRDAFNAEKYFYIQSSSGDFQSIRYEFTLSNDRLKFTTALGFSPCPNEDDCAYLIPLSGSDITQLEANPPGIQLKGAALISCQNGSSACTP